MLDTVVLLISEVSALGHVSDVTDQESIDPDYQVPGHNAAGTHAS